jgi:hypothetical protein
MSSSAHVPPSLRFVQSAASFQSASSEVLTLLSSPPSSVNKARILHLLDDVLFSHLLDMKAANREGLELAEEGEAEVAQKRADAERDFAEVEALSYQKSNLLSKASNLRSFPTPNLDSLANSEELPSLESASSAALALLPNLYVRQPTPSEHLSLLSSLLSSRESLSAALSQYKATHLSSSSQVERTSELLNLYPNVMARLHAALADDALDHLREGGGEGGDAEESVERENKKREADRVSPGEKGRNNKRWRGGGGKR